MNREQIISKIQSMLRLAENTDFDGEASAAARMIDKLCKQYGITIENAKTPIAKDEEFSSYTRRDGAYIILLNAVAKFYGASLYLKTDYYTDKKTYQIIGTEAQQIQTRLYFEFLNDSMLQECETTYKAEKIIAELQGKTLQRSFRNNFKKAFATRVAIRLNDMMAERDNGADAEAVKNKLSTIKLSKSRSFSGARGAGAYAGYDSGSVVSLNRQTSGSKQMALSASR
jgi:hypothetical protein